MKLFTGECHRTSLKKVNISLGNGLVPSDKWKPLPEPVLNLICVIIWHHWVNRCGTEFISEIIKMHSLFLLFHSSELVPIFEIIPQRRQSLAYPAYSISWLIIAWWRNEPGYQQSWYWFNVPGILLHEHHETKWSPFSRQHFWTHFHEWKLLYFYQNFIEICSGDKFVTWTNDGLLKWHIYASLVLSELTDWDLNNVAHNLQIFLNVYSMKINIVHPFRLKYCVLIKISLKWVPDGQVN